MMTFALLFAIGVGPEPPLPSDVDLRNEQTISEAIVIARQNRLVMRLVMGFDLCGFTVFYIAVRKAAREARINEERVIAIGTNIDQMLLLMRAEATVQAHVIEQARIIAQGNSVKLDAVKSQIDANTASIISEAKVSGDSAFNMPTPILPEVP